MNPLSNRPGSPLAAPALACLVASLCACTPGSVVCNAPDVACATNVCARLDTDPQHCGSCSVSCPTGQACVQGACVCPSGARLCAGVCSDTGSDASNCGDCGKACKGLEFCDAGKCVSACPTGKTTCGLSCVDLTGDPLHCGRCETSCAQGQSCVDSACRSTVFAACFNSDELVGLDDDLVPAAASVTAGDGPQSILEAAGRVRVGSSLDKQLYAFDPATLQRDTLSDALGNGFNQVVLGTLAWAVNSLDNDIQGLDLSKQAGTNRTVDQLPTAVGNPASEVNTNPWFAAASGSRLYVVLLGACYPDPATGAAAGNRMEEVDVSAIPARITREIVFHPADYQKDAAAPSNSPRPAGVAVVGTTAYVAIGNLTEDCLGPAGPGYLAVIDLSGATLAATNVKLPDACRNPGFVAATPSRIYVTCTGAWGSNDGKALVVLDATTRAVLKTTTFPTCAPTDPTDGPNACRSAAPGRMTFHSGRLLIADAAAGRLFITDAEGVLVPGREAGVKICPLACNATGTGCLQYTSDVFAVR